MVTFSALLVICAGTSSVTGEFPAQRLMTRSFDVFFDLHLNKRLSKQSWGWWFETKSRPSWRHCIEISLKFVPQGPVNNIPTLVQIMAIVPSRRQAIIWTNGGILYWRTYAWLFVCVIICLREYRGSWLGKAQCCKNALPIARSLSHKFSNGKGSYISEW